MFLSEWWISPDPDTPSCHRCTSDEAEISIDTSSGGGGGGGTPSPFVAAPSAAPLSPAAAPAATAAHGRWSVTQPWSAVPSRAT